MSFEDKKPDELEYDADGHILNELPPEPKRATCNEPGVCPKCGSINIEYGESTTGDGVCLYPFKCNDCGAEAHEVYDQIFALTEEI
jgi:hypothetical protein